MTAQNRLIVLGATGDLVKKKIAQALSVLGADYISYGRRNIDSPDYIKGELNEISTKLATQAITHAYVALPPTLYELVLTQLAQLPHIPRIALEKPFGTSLAGANTLIDVITRLGIRDRVYLVDHYLGKFSPDRDRYMTDQISKIEIAATETNDVDHRGAFYDSVGIINDYIQNHVMMIISSLICCGTRSDTLARIVYLPGSLQTAQYSGFRDIGGVNPTSNTETAVNLSFSYDNLFDINVCAGKSVSKAAVVAKIYLHNGENVVVDINKGGNSYESILGDFLADTSLYRLSFGEALQCWNITEQILADKVGKTPVIYEKGSDTMHIWKH